MPITINGTTGISGVDGSAAAPALQGSDTNTGIAFGSDVIIGSTNGTEAFRVDSSGRLGLGASAPDERLVVAGAIRATSNAANWASSDGAVVDYYAGDMRIVAARAGSNSSTIQFHTYNSGTAAERMRISNAGGVFVSGTTSPVSGNPSDGIHTGSGGGHFGDTALTLGDGIASARWRLVTGGYHLNFYQNNGSGTYVSRAYVTNSTGAYVAVSDSRAKKDIVDADYGIDTLKQLRPVSYLMKDQDETTARRNLGFIAQEVLGVVPEAVNVPADPEQMYGLESSALIPVLVSSLQEAIAKIETLEAKVAALESA